MHVSQLRPNAVKINGFSTVHTTSLNHSNALPVLSLTVFVFVLLGSFWVLMALVGSKMAPSWLQGVLRSPIPPQLGLNIAQLGLNTASRWLNMAQFDLNMAQFDLNMAQLGPIWPQHGSTWPSKTFKNLKKP